MEHLARYKGIHTIFAITLLVGGITLLLPEAAFERAIRENGPIEMLTAVGFIVAAAWLFNEGFQKRLSHGFSSGFITLFLGLRELDFHTRFTTMGIFKTKFYISDKVPVTEKLIVSIIVLTMLGILLLYAKKHLPTFITKLKAGSRSALSIAMAMGLAVFSKTLDRNSDLIMDFVGIFSAVDLTQFLLVAEETSELAIPLFILLAIAYTGRQNDASQLAAAAEH